VRLLVDHRERLVGQSTALINDLRWNLHDLWPELQIPARALIGARWQQRLAGRLARAQQIARVRIARDELRRIRDLTRSIDALEHELDALIADIAPRLLAEPGCGVLTAAKLIGEIAGIQRFSSDAKLARLAGTAPIPASSGRPRATALTAAATASSTAHYTASPSTKAATTRRPPPTSHADRLKAKPDAKRCAASNVTSPAASGNSYNPPSSQRPPPSPSTATRPQTASP
jgi:transposase